MQATCSVDAGSAEEPREAEGGVAVEQADWIGGPGAVAGQQNLRAEDLVPEQPGFIVVVPDVFTAEECRRMSAAIDRVGLNPPNGADLNPRKNEAFLCRHSLSFVDPHLELVVWERLWPHLPPVGDCRAVGFDGSLRYYRYGKGDQFG